MDAERVGRLADRPFDAGWRSGRTADRRSSSRRARSAPRSGAARRTGPAGSARSCPASRMTWRSAAVADVEHARHEPAGPRDEGPAGLDRQARRAPVGRDGLEERRAARGRTGPGPGAGSPSAKTGKPPPTSSVSKVSIEPRHRAVDGERPPDGVAPGIDRAELRPDVQVDPTGPERRPGARRRPRSPSPSSVSVIPNLEPPAPTARPARVSGATSGLSR